MPIFPTDVIVSVAQGGPQGPSGPPIDSNNFVQLSSSSGYFYQIKNEQKYKILIPTGIEHIQVIFNPILTTTPVIYCNMSIDDDTMYSYCVKSPNATGCYIYFSDIIQETGAYLYILAKTDVNYVNSV